MGLSAASLLASAGLTPTSTVAWGIRPAVTGPGVYVISLHADPANGAGLPTAPIDPDAVRALLAARPELTHRGRRPDPQALAAALAAMFPPDQPVLYVGKATNTAHRLAQYYRTRIGARSPHAGGWPLKMLTVLDQVHIHAVATPDPGRVEKALLATFMAAVPAHDRQGLSDPAMPLPYANLDNGAAVRKNHGIDGARAPR